MTDEGALRATYIGGPTILLEWGGLRLLTDPTFDAAGTEYRFPTYTLRKTAGPAIATDAVGRVDVVLLSHDHHADNLDTAGRALLGQVTRIVTTSAAAERLGARAIGLAAWQTVEIPADDGRVLRITGTPARHGPVAGDRGPVTGFILAFRDRPDRAVYISGDTVWYDGVAAVGARFAVDVAILFMGAARVPAVELAHLTLTAAEGVEVARAFPTARIVPVHVDGWAHFSESRRDVTDAFAAAGLDSRLVWLDPGRATTLLTPLAATGAALATRLAAQGSAVWAVLADRSAADLERRPTAGGWCAREHVAHLARYQQVFLDRIASIFADDRPQFRRYQAADDPQFAPWLDLPVDHLRVRFAEVRARLVEVVAALDGAALARTGVHPAFGEMSVALWTEFFLAHEGHHIYATFRCARVPEQSA